MSKMTKAEREHLAAVTGALSLHRAWRLDPQIAPDVPPPPPGGYLDYTSGWEINTHTATINSAWSKSSTHGWGVAPVKNGSASKESRALYSTRLLALRALHAAMAWRFATALVEVDEEIAKEAAKEAK